MSRESPARSGESPARSRGSPERSRGSPERRAARGTRGTAGMCPARRCADGAREMESGAVVRTFVEKESAEPVGKMSVGKESASQAQTVVAQSAATLGTEMTSFAALETEGEVVVARVAGGASVVASAFAGVAAVQRRAGVGAVAAAS
jgi:hypothetical protein